jgi:hypothetical protein
MTSHISLWRLTESLEKRSTTGAMVGLALAALPFNLAIFPWRTAHLRETSGVAAPILDIRFAYSPESVFDLASRLGERGRRFYALSELTVDLVYPLLYSSLFGLLLARLLPRAFPSRPRWRHLALVPFAALTCDYAENVSLAIILLGFPSTMPVAPVASLCTTTKWIFGGTSIVMIAISSLKLLIDRGTTCQRLAVLRAG